MLVIGDEVVRWVAARTGEHGEHPYGAARGIGWERDGRLVGGVVFNDYNGPNVCMHVASDRTRRWLTRRFLWTVFDYPFVQLNCTRVTGLVGEGNHDARRFDEHIGFTLETRLKDAHPTGDMLVYVMRRQDCRWLQLKEKL